MTDLEEKQFYLLNVRRDNSVLSESSSSPPIWLISFTDVIALMLTFFVLLYSMSDPNPEKFERKIGVTIFGEAQFTGPDNSGGNDEGDNIDRLNFNQAEDLKYIATIITQTILSRNMETQFKLKQQGDLLMIYMHPDMKVNNRDFLLFLSNIEPVFQSLDNRIELVGDPESASIFDDLQTLGRVLKSYGYRHAVSIATRDLQGSGMQSRMAIGIRSNDGRRIIDVE